MEPIHISPQAEKTPFVQPVSAGGYTNESHFFKQKKGLFQGRANRKNFLARVCLLLVISIVLLTVGVYLPDTSPLIDIYSIFCIVYLIVALVSLFSITTKRVHDMGLTGYICLLYLLPIIDIFFFIYIICYPGKTEDNEYGNPQSSKLQGSASFGRAI